MRMLLALMLLAWTCPAKLAASADGPFPRLLPPATDFHLTVRQEPASKLPLGPGCSREASLTLVCRAFTVILENAGTRTVRIYGLRCFEPLVTFERKEPNSSSGWWPISQPQPGNPSCDAVDWTNSRLRPGERIQYFLCRLRRRLRSGAPRGQEREQSGHYD
jgi:hypothetical protein